MSSNQVLAQSGLKFWQRLVNLAREQEKQLGYSSNKLLLCPLVKTFANL